MLALVIEGLVILREQSRAGELYPLACELIETGAVALWPIARFTQTIAGIAAAAARRWESAERHFQIAREQAARFPNRFECAEVERFQAIMLVERGEANDRDAARKKLSTALQVYEQIGMPRHAQMVQTILASGLGV